MNVTRLMLGSAAFMLFAPAMAQAQQAEPVKPMTELSGSLTVRYDSNVARTDEALAAQRGLTRSDERATPALRFSIARPLGRNSLSLTADAGYDFYRRNKRLNRERISVDGNARLALGPCDLSLMPSYARRQSDLSDLALVTIPGSESVRNTETVQNYAGELRCGRQYGIRPVATVSRAIGDNSTEVRRLSDYRTLQYGGGLSYANPVIGDFTLQYLRNDTDYPHRPASFGRGGYSSDRVQFQAEREIGAILRATGMLSYITLDPDQPTAGVKGFRGLGWLLTLSATPLPDLQLTGNVGRDVLPTLGTDALYQINRRYSAGADYALNSTISLSLLGTIEDRNYVGATNTFGPALTDSVQRTITGGVSFAYSPRMGVGLDVGYQNRNANGTIYDYDNTFAALRTNITF